MLQQEAFSRFLSTPTTLFDGHEVPGQWVKPSILTRELRDDQIVKLVVTSAMDGLPHAISYELYGTTLLDWLLIAFNDADEVFGWPRAGEVIKAPIRSLVLAELV